MFLMTWSQKYCFVGALLFSINVYQCLAAQLPTDWRNRLDDSVLQANNQLTPRSSYIQGDVLLYEADNNGLHDGKKNYSFIGNWPVIQRRQQFQRKILYYLDSSDGWSAPEIEEIKLALNDLSRRSNYCFIFIKKRTKQGSERYIDFARLTTQESCWATMHEQHSNQPSPYKIVLSPLCIQVSQIQHLLLHSLGLMHENVRPDRDQHVTLFNDNIDHKYRLDANRTISYLGNHSFPYDLDSIMHLPYNYASSSNLPAILPRSSMRKHRMGQRYSLSAMDVLKLQKLYGCQPQYYPVQLIRHDEDVTIIQPDFNKIRRLNYNKDSLDNMIRRGVIDVKYLKRTDTHGSSAIIEMITFKEEANAEVARDVMAALKDYQPVFGVEFINNMALLDGYEIGDLVNSRTVHLRFTDYEDGFTSDHFRHLMLDNVELLEFVGCHYVQILRNGLADFPRLRMLVFEHSLSPTLHLDAFTGLNDLRRVSLDAGLGQERIYDTNRYFKHLRKVHCGCSENDKWIRELIRRMPDLIKPVGKGEIYRYESIVSPAYPRNEMFKSVNCTQRDSMQMIINDSGFSVNDRCN